MNFFKDNLWLIAIALISGGALLVPILQRRGAKVSTLEAIKLMNQGKTLVLDVRKPEEFAVGHLQGAVNIPIDDLSTRLKEIEKFKKLNVITVCESGVRSATASVLLGKAGFESIVSLDGGVAAWKSQGLPTVK